MIHLVVAHESPMGFYTNDFLTIRLKERNSSWLNSMVGQIEECFVSDEFIDIPPQITKDKAELSAKIKIELTAYTRNLSLKALCKLFNSWQISGKVSSAEVIKANDIITHHSLKYIHEMRTPDNSSHRYQEAIKSGAEATQQCNSLPARNVISLPPSSSSSSVLPIVGSTAALLAVFTALFCRSRRNKHTKASEQRHEQTNQAKKSPQL